MTITGISALPPTIEAKSSFRVRLSHITAAAAKTSLYRALTLVVIFVRFNLACRLPALVYRVPASGSDAL